MMDKFRLDGKTSMVTGGSRGIGLGIATALAEAGADIVVVARDAANLEEVRRRLADTGRTVRTYPFDVSRFEDLPEFYRQVSQDTGGVDILVNNAGGIMSETVRSGAAVYAMTKGSMGNFQ